MKCHAREICAGAVVLLSAGLAWAEMPQIELWSQLGQSLKTGADQFDTNRWYAAASGWEISGMIANAATSAPVRVEDLVVRLACPPGLAVDVRELKERNGLVYGQCDATQTSLIFRSAAALTNQSTFYLAADLVTSNTWAHPRVAVSRACDVTTVGAQSVITQCFVVRLTVPPGALDGCTNLEVGLPDWPYQNMSLRLALITNAAPTNFVKQEWASLPTYSAADPSGLAGTYVFTNILSISNGLDHAVAVMPEVEVRYAARRLEATHPGQWSTRLEHGGGMAVVVSSPQIAGWSSQWSADAVRMALAAKRAPVAAGPGLTDIRLARAQSISLNGLPYQSLMASADGSNLLAAVFTTPGNRTYDMEVEEGGAAYLEPRSLTTADLAEFTNGTYRLDLLDFTNGTARSYTFDLRGQAIPQFPVLRTPTNLCTVESQPMISWPAPTPAHVSHILLTLDNAMMESEDFNFWPGNTTTSYVPGTALFAATDVSVMYGDLQMSSAGDASLLSGYLAIGQGLFNVISNGFLPAVAHLAAEPASTVDLQPVQFEVANYGFLSGGGLAFQLAYGDGAQTNVPAASHAYAAEGVFTARVVVADAAGGAATGRVAVTVYPRPEFDAVERSAANRVTLRLPTVDGAVYRTYYTDSLRAPSWSSVATVLSGTGGVMSLRTAGAQQPRFYQLRCVLPEAGEAFDPLAFPMGNPADVIKLAAFGIPNWSGTEPHNGIDLEVNHLLYSAAIVAPLDGQVTGIEASTNPYSEPPGQLMLDVTIRSDGGLEAHLVLEPSTTNPATIANQTNAVHVSVGDMVAAGAHVADLLVGELGYPHLHFMAMRNQSFLCPYGYSSPAAQAIYDALAAYPSSSVPDGNICYGQP